MSSMSNGEADADCQFLEHVLDQLYDFGNGPAPKKKLKSRKKKKGKGCEGVEEVEEEEFPAVKEVYSWSIDGHDGTEQSGPAIRPGSQVEVVTFQDPRKKLKTKEISALDEVPALQTTEKNESDQLEQLNLEKARLEVHRFGITGFKKEQQRAFEQDRAIMLGAKPPKKTYVNYKKLQQQIVEKKQKTKEDVQPDLKKKKKQSNQRDKKKKTMSSGSGTAPTGQLGRFKNGMLILSPMEIQKIKGKKRRN